MDSPSLSTILTHLITGTLTDDLLQNSNSAEDLVLTEKIRALRDELDIREQTCKRMDAVFGSSPQPIIITDEEYRVTSVNPSFLCN